MNKYIQLLLVSTVLFLSYANMDGAFPATAQGGGASQGDVMMFMPTAKILGERLKMVGGFELFIQKTSIMNIGGRILSAPQVYLEISVCLDEFAVNVHRDAIFKFAGSQCLKRRRAELIEIVLRGYPQAIRELLPTTPV